MYLKMLHVFLSFSVFYFKYSVVMDSFDHHLSSENVIYESL